MEHATTKLDSSPTPRHPSSLLRLIAQTLSIGVDDIVDLELYLADTQPAQIGGIHGEFVHAPRLDNLFNTYAGLNALVESLGSLNTDSNIRLVCLFDHEEVGSTSTQGANSIYTSSILKRLCQSMISTNCKLSNGQINSDWCFDQLLARSFLISADQTHALHPLWPDKHEFEHKPLFHRGLVLKFNSNQRYSTNSLTSSVIRELAKLSEVPVQVGFQLNKL